MNVEGVPRSQDTKGGLISIPGLSAKFQVPPGALELFGWQYKDTAGKTSRTIFELVTSICYGKRGEKKLCRASFAFIIKLLRALRSAS